MRTPAFLILGCFALMTFGPAGSALLNWLSPRSELTAAYLMLTAPFGMLAWGIVRQKGWHLSESKTLQVWSALNTILVFVGILAFFAFVFRSCVLGFLPPGAHSD